MDNSIGAIGYFIHDYNAKLARHYIPFHNKQVQ
jgi:hypothetical protein